MEEYGAGGDVVSIRADLAGAVFAIGLASEMLEMALERFSRKDYSGSMEESRNTMRMSSSALLLKDGFMAGSFEATASYLSMRYPGRFPVSAWHDAETALPGKEGGIFGVIVCIFGKEPKEKPVRASKALHAAQIFLKAARREI